MPDFSDITKKATKSIAKAKELVELQLYTQQQVPSFSPQCFLLEKAGDIQEAINNGSIQAPTPGENTKTPPVRQLRSNITGRKSESNLSYIQYITKMQKTNYESYFGYSPHDIAQMAHYMSVEEVLTNKKAEIIKSFPIMNTDMNLKDYAKVNDLLLESRAKRQGAGIESLNIDFVGIDSFTKKQVYMTAKFFFQDIKTMLSSPYANLFTLETSREINNEKAFRSIDFHIGWKSNNPKIKKQISNLNLTVRTHLVKYSFDVRQDGSIVVDGTYRGYYVEGFSGPQANILEIAKTRYLEIKQRQEEIEARAGAIKIRNKKNINEAQLKKFVLSRIKKDVERKKIEILGSEKLEIIEIEGRPIKELLAVIGEIKEDVKKRIAIDIAFKPELFPEYATNSAKAPQKEKIDFVKNKAFPVGAGASKKGKFNPIIESVFSAPRIAEIKEYKSYRKFFGDLETEINFRLNNSMKNSEVSQTNLVRAKQTALEEQTRLASLARLKALQIIADNLFSSSKIFYAKIPRDVVRNFKLASASASRVNVAAAFRRLPPDNVLFKDQLRLSEKDFNDENYQVVPFVFFGNLLENILNVPAAYKEKDGEMPIPDTDRTVYDLMREVGSNVKIDLGFLSYNTPYTGDRVSNLKLYYLPISLVELNNFFARVVLAKGKIVYSFSEFVNDLLKRFLTGIFSSCSKESNTKGFGAPVVETTIGDRPEGRSKATQYFIHGAKNTIHDLVKSDITPENFGKYKANLNASIPHFFVFGKNTGIEKNIKLTDIADDQLKVAQYYSPRSSLVNDINGNEQLKRTGFMPTVFQSEVETIGFPLMNLGQLIYIDLKPTITVNKAKSRPFDASGYYGVIKVSHSISRDRFSTNITSILQISDKDSGIIRQGLGGLDSGGARKEGKFISTGVGAYVSRWEAASDTVGEQPSPEEQVTALTPSYDPALEINQAFIGDFDSAEVIQFVKLLRIGVNEGFFSQNFIKQYDAILNAPHPPSSDFELAVLAFESNMPDKRREKPKKQVVFEFGLSLEDALDFGLGIAPIGAYNVAAATPQDKLNNLINVLNQQFDEKAQDQIVKILVPILKSGAEGQFGELSARENDSYIMLIVREYDDGKVEINAVVVTR